MTIRDFSDRFDVLLNSYADTQAFGKTNSPNTIVLDEYEKSVFLTQAEKDLVNDYYNGNNMDGASYEEKEKIREVLDSLVETKEYSANQAVDSTGTFKKVRNGDYDIAFAYPSNLMFITFEKVIFSSYISGCNAAKSALVVPTTHDELWHRIQNPYRGPSWNRVLRLNASNNIAELISDHPVGSYILRYIREPKPIILTDLSDGLAIDSLSSVTECELPDACHEEVLQRAVRLAYQAKGVYLNKQQD